jgi:hypothetical protein
VLQNYFGGEKHGASGLDNSVRRGDHSTHEGRDSTTRINFRESVNNQISKMNIDVLTLGQLKEIHSLLGESNHPSKNKASLPMGQNITVLDRGFVYVGEVTDEGEWVRITRASNIRVWGTKKGLGELRTGPTKDTILDECGEVLVAKKAVIHLIPCSGF